jgi:prolyl oligopeptidase
VFCAADHNLPRKREARLFSRAKPFFYYEIIEGGHKFGVNLKESAETKTVDYNYLTHKLMD